MRFCRLDAIHANLPHAWSRCNHPAYKGFTGQLLESWSQDGFTRYAYDAEGNLARKVLPDGREWTYAWNAAGMLAKVVRPDGKEVEFGYDALGRRVWKKYQGKTTKWIWDGNVPVHEWVELDPGVAETPAPEKIAEAEDAGLRQRAVDLAKRAAQGPPVARNDHGSATSPITWVFEPESFAPAAKLVGGQQHAIITDYLGTPTAMLDADGRTVWSADIGIYGDLRNVTGDKQACPFRWPGEYEDEETGLYYNRFRYYDPESGEYVSQDPIGLAGQNPTLYGYVRDPLLWIDCWGLECWSTGRKKFWKAEAKANPGKYSANNLKRMEQGKAPRMTVQALDRKTGAIVTKDVSLELHHAGIPQRVGGSGVHSPSNLDIVTPWQHEAADPFRHTGDDLIQTITGVDAW